MFFETYIDAAIDAATKTPPLIRMSGLKRVVEEAVRDYGMIERWPSDGRDKEARRIELNRAVGRANEVLVKVREGLAACMRGGGTSVA